MPVRIVDQLSHGDRRNRYCRHALARRRRDIGRAGEPGPDVGHLLVEHDDHLEVGRLRPDRARRRRLNRAVADFSDVTFEGLVGQRVDRDLGLLAELHVWDARFVDLDLRLNHGHFGQRQQDRAGIVHRADDRRFALLDVAPRDDAINGRFDSDFAEVVARALEPGAFLGDAAALRHHLFFALLKGRFSRLQVVLGFLERFARRELTAPEILLALERLTRLLHLDVRRLDGLLHLIQRALRGLERGCAAVDPGPQRLRIDLEEELALLDPVPLVHRQVHHAARSVGADVDEALRLNLAGRRHNGLEIPASDDLGRDHDRLVSPEVQARGGHGGAGRDHRYSDESVLPGHLYSRQRRLDGGEAECDHQHDGDRLPGDADRRPVGDPGFHLEHLRIVRTPAERFHHRDRLI